KSRLYNIAATLLAAFIEQGRYFTRMVVTVQKEVAQRMFASVGSKDYSSFTVLCNSVYKVTPLMILKGASFYPPPHVDSQAVRLDLREDRTSHQETALFYSMVRALFANRRKTIKNNLTVFIAAQNRRSIQKRNGSTHKEAVLSRPPDATQSDPSELASTILHTAGIDERARAEQLSLESFRTIAMILETFYDNSGKPSTP
ncbi:MAG: rRNA adenine N-6-methyltransferase family protein, partial [Termitinemataceae bacterium]